MAREIYQPLTDADFDEAFPNSSKVYLEGPQGVRVPVREIAVSGGEPAVHVYDASGPRHHDSNRACPRFASDGSRPGATPTP